MAAKKKAPNRGTSARRIARNVVGSPKASRVETPKPLRKVKHKKELAEDS